MGTYVYRPSRLPLVFLSAHFLLCLLHTVGSVLRSQVENYSYNFEEPCLYALIFLLFFFNGAGPLSVDSVVYEQVKEEED